MSDTQWKNSHAAVAGTLLVAFPCDLHSVVVNTGAAGSVEVHDTAVAPVAGAATMVAKIDTAAQEPLPFGVRLRAGLAFIQVGVADVTLIWS